MKKCLSIDVLIALTLFGFFTNVVLAQTPAQPTDAPLQDEPKTEPTQRTDAPPVEASKQSEEQAKPVQRPKPVSKPRRPPRKPKTKPKPPKAKVSAPVAEEPLAPEPPPTAKPESHEDEKGSGLLGLPPLRLDPGQFVLLSFLWLLITLVLWMMRRTRFLSIKNVTLQRYASLSYGALRFIAVVLGLTIVVLALPVPTVIKWAVLLAAAVALGVSMRHLLADMIAGFVLLFERRIKKGMWVSGESFQGSVERRGLRATWLRDGQGHQLAVPNRVMIGDPIVYDTGGDTEHEVTLKLTSFAKAPNIRQCLHDSVLSSPWVLAGATPVVLRDPSDPDVWRVRSRLLEPRFAVKFEGELLERVEDLLRHDLALHMETVAADDEAMRPTKPNDDSTQTNDADDKADTVKKD